MNFTREAVDSIERDRLERAYYEYNGRYLEVIDHDDDYAFYIPMIRDRGETYKRSTLIDFAKGLRNVVERSRSGQ